LSDPKKRARYDEFGDDGEDTDFNANEWLSAYEYYRSLHPEITKEDIKSFTERYKGSDEEAEDLSAFYEEMEGDISKIMQFIMCSTDEDLPRYMEFFENQFKIGLLEKTEAYETS